MTAKHGLWILAVAVLAGAASGCGAANSSGSNTTATAPADALGFPPSTPAWIVAAATTTAESLEDAHAKVVSVSLGGHPIVVLAGTFTCTLCSRPRSSTAVPTGTYAALRYDAATRDGTDFGLADSAQQALSGLCNGSPCTAAEPPAAVSPPIARGLGRRPVSGRRCRSAATLRASEARP